MMQEQITCPVCERGKLLPLLSSSSTNWVCSQPDCDYIIHQHGSDNTKVWKGRATREDRQSPDSWLNTP